MWDFDIDSKMRAIAPFIMISWITMLEYTPYWILNSMAQDRYK